MSGRNSEQMEESFELALDRERRFLELLLDDPALSVLRAKMPGHPAVLRYNKISQFLDQSYSLSFPDELSFVADILSAGLDSMTMATAATPEELLKSISDQEVLRQLRNRVTDPHQYHDQMSAFNCWTLLTSKGIHAELIEREGFPDIRMNLPSGQEWVECKRKHIGSPISRIRKIIKKSNNQIKHADSNGTGFVYITVERPEQRTVLDDKLPTVIAEYIAEVRRELNSGASRSVAAVVIAWDDHMVMGEPPAHTLHVARRRSACHFHTSPRRLLGVPKESLVLGRTVAVYVNWSNQVQPGPPLESIRANNIVVTQLFRQECELPGLVRSVHAFAVIEQPDEIVSYDLSGITVILATKWVRSAESPFALIAIGHRMGDKSIEVDLAFRAYPDVLPIIGVSNPAEIFIKFVERYGLMVSVGEQTGLFIPSGRVTVPVGGPAGFVQVHNPMNHPFAVCAVCKMERGVADVHWAFAIDNYRYQRDVKQRRR